MAEVSDPQDITELTDFVQSTLKDLQGKFKVMSEGIVGKIDNMGGKIDDLEKNIAELLAQAGMEEQELNNSVADITE